VVFGAAVWLGAVVHWVAAPAFVISQLLYHVQVMMVAKGLTTADVYRHL
jgi:phosphoribosyl-ATP pyrophosphohydrolase